MSKAHFIYKNNLNIFENINTKYMHFFRTLTFFEKKNQYKYLQSMITHIVYNPGCNGYRVIEIQRFF